MRTKTGIIQTTEAQSVDALRVLIWEETWAEACRKVGRIWHALRGAARIGTKTGGLRVAPTSGYCPATLRVDGRTAKGMPVFARQQLPSGVSEELKEAQTS